MHTSASGVYADLHTHTTSSDGTLAPEALVARAAECGIQVLAVTDHDTVDGLGEAQEAAVERGLHFVAGIELSATVEGEEVHLLAYGIDPSDAALETHLRDMQAARENRAWTMIERLRRQGVEIAEEVLERKMVTTHAVGRPHVAAALLEEGHVDTMEEAFAQYIGNEAPAYVAKPDVPARRALRVIHGAGGVGVLAHPGHWTPRAQIRTLVDDGLDGIEIWHPSHDASLQGYYRRLAAGYDLMETGGSDFHGRAEGDDHTLGTVGMNEEAWERFRVAAA
jgi:predicted metal-dependent phosphoesterase TrpH